MFASSYEQKQMITNGSYYTDMLCWTRFVCIETPLSAYLCCIGSCTSNSEIRIRSHAHLCGIWGGQNCAGTRFSQSTMVFTRHYHSTNVSYPFSHLSSTLCKLNLASLKNKALCLWINTNTAVLAELLKLWFDGRNLFLTIFIQKYNELLFCYSMRATRLVIPAALSKFSCVGLGKYANYLW
jgi:hypothetical protein